MKDYNDLVSFFLRSGIAIAFLYAAMSSFLEPTSWIGFFPIWLTNIISGKILLILFSIYEIILALWLISNKRIYYAAILSAVTFILIILSNITALDIVFRDIPILFASMALAVMYYKKD